MNVEQHSIGSVLKATLVLHMLHVRILQLIKTVFWFSKHSVANIKLKIHINCSLVTNSCALFIATIIFYIFKGIDQQYFRSLYKEADQCQRWKRYDSSLIM